MKILRFNLFIIGLLILVFGGCAANLNTQVSLTDYDKSASNIVIQYAYFPNNGELVSEFEKNPSFTLYGDGRLIYSEFLVFPMFMMPGYYGGPIFVYQPSYQLSEIMLSENDVLGYIEYLNDRDFLNLDKLYDNNPSYNGIHKVTLNLKWKKKTVESIGNSAPQGLNEIINYLHEYIDFSGNAKIYDYQKMGITCEEFNFPLAYVPNWQFPTVNLDNLAGSVDGKVVKGQLKVDILEALTTNSRFYMFNGSTYVVYYKPLLP